MPISLPQIEQQLGELLGKIGLRTTLERAVEIGRLLDEARLSKGWEHGDWGKWLARLGLKRQTANDYQLVYRGRENVRPGGQIGLRAFVAAMRAGKRQRPAGPPADDPALAPDAEVRTADCRTFDWPTGAALVYADPPWADVTAYDWLANFAPRVLRPGGLLMCQCIARDLPDRLARLASGGMAYYWCFAIAYDQSRSSPAYVVSSNWRPVLVFAKGKPRHEVTSDTFTVRGGLREKDLHVWQQPLAPMRYWLERLTSRGDLVLDPFAGAGTIPLACRLAGRRCVATEIDEGTARIARKRVREGGQGEGQDGGPA